MTSIKNDKEPVTELLGPDAAMYRAMTARANYLAQDRSDIQFAVKELCSKKWSCSSENLKKRCFF